MYGFVGDDASELRQQSGSMLVLHDKDAVRPPDIADADGPARIGAGASGPCPHVRMIAPYGLGRWTPPLVPAADEKNVEGFVVLDFVLVLARWVRVVDAKLPGTRELCRPKLEKLPVLLSFFLRLDVIFFHVVQRLN